MGGMKQYAKRKYRKGKKPTKKGVKINYADQHNLKVQGTSCFIWTSGSYPSVQANNALCVTVNPELRPPNLSVFAFGGALQFSLGNAINLAALATYWDRIKCNEIKVRVIPQINFASVGSGLIPTMRTVFDFDDAVTPTSSQMWARRGKTHRLDKPFTFSFKPRVLYTGVTALSLSQKSPYMNNASALTIPLYGVKFGVRDWPLQAPTDPLPNILRFEITYMCTMKEQQWINTPVNIADYGVLLPGQVAPVANEVMDVSGNIYDLSGNMIKAPDEFGWEHPWTGPTGLPYTGPTGPGPCYC
ncbi:coat protein [Lake Sarah-associated circular virus-4]|uniref:coat protein n=1 Tax=Lake Sarah-associated circular virus-4 TaxID=1685768 RepID=UPI000777C9F8|nr:coat protein [Lake Sarah-associated circular virus-4]ALE29584.1 coat protein [Lake Sarah-associated circular virus-4]ALE29586.1 coat protein [Lake Sarah-associated circular virus-4]ALE29588.1 coat protein [Lake Sarah-associated circular virus-4]ALE29590.1 coat protein [Lake Sarah-associated circular virus-4]ALE29592.1 coat protein [Lake Sarah-associated circular virus-4]